MTTASLLSAGRLRTFAALAAGAAVVTAAVVLAPDGWAAALTGWVRSAQAEYQTSLAAAVRELVHGRPLVAGGTLAALSFLYGVFHALGPGHGKAVVATYAATTLAQARRAVILSFGAAFVQALSAIVLVGGVFLLIDGGSRWATRVGDRYLEPASYAAIAAVGGWLLLRGLLAMRRGARHGHDHDHHHHHDHHHDHDDHHHAHGDGEACGCGHAHAPTPDQVAQATDWRRIAALSFAIGLRPCTGAILVLVLSFGSGLWAAGIAATLSMSLGTALTVSVLAVAAGALGRAARRMVAGDGTSAASVAAGRRVGAGLSVLGGSAILALGLLLLLSALDRPSHPMLGEAPAAVRLAASTAASGPASGPVAR